jgi:3-oxoacyl-[acyl-carrier-protein] synthase-3
LLPFCYEEFMPLFYHFDEIVIAGIQAALPEQIVTTAELEQQLAPLYERLRLPAGRLELMTGIRERRVWPADLLPGTQSARTAEQLLNRLAFPREQIGQLVHGSVCRDYLEPATACGVHHALGLSNDCVIYDLSNACLGLMNGVIQVATAIQAGQISAGLVVGTEQSRPLMETTIAALNRDQTLTRESVKLAIASLTIGSGSAAILVTHRRFALHAPRLSSAVVATNTAHHRLCHSGRDESAGAGMAPLMTTDSEQLMQAGIALGAETFQQWLQHERWTTNDIQQSVCHQVGLTHRKLMLQALQLPAENDFYTVDWLGNTGSTALPMTYALAAEQGRYEPGQRVAMLGIGSGINVVFAALEH